ncbi:MAG TPA: hypothetical protein VMU39_14190 [Solirubrobacteraceae bacterium]|nr:hypothetical protein [Solirubrobacteraceae bacterium]
MLETVPAAWLLLALPFLSSAVIESVNVLRTLTARHNRLMRLIGIIGVSCLLAGLLGVIPPVATFPAIIAGGALSGYAVFVPPRPGGGEDGGDDWHGGGPPPDDPPPRPPGDPIDWEQFDRLRQGWDRVPAGRS